MITMIIGFALMLVIGKLFGLGSFIAFFVVTATIIAVKAIEYKSSNYTFARSKNNAKFDEMFPKETTTHMPDDDEKLLMAYIALIEKEQK